MFDPRSWLTLGLAALLLLMGAVAGVQTMRVAGLKSDLATERADRARETAERERVAREAAQRIANLEAEHASQQQALSDAYQKEMAARDAALAAARADADSLRDEVERYAAGPGASAEASAAACRDFRDRAATLGDLFRRADRLAERMAGAAERHAGEARLLKRQLMIDRGACAPETQGESGIANAYGQN